MDPIEYIFEKPSLSGRIAKWQMLLSEYDILYVTQKAVKGSVVADYLAEQAIDDLQPMSLKFPDGEVMSLEIENQKDPDKWIMLFDGASNIVGNGIGAVLISPKRKVTPFTAKLYFECTNNVSEYEACAMGIQAAIDAGIKRLQVYGDSQLVIRQLNDEWETRDVKLVPYYQCIKKLIKFFDFVEFDHIPREENQMADALATLAAMFDLDPQAEVEVIKIETRDVQAHCLNIVAEPDGKPWYYDVKQYLVKGEYPLEALDNDKRTIRRLSGSFFWDGTVLYKRSPGFVLLRCVDVDEARRIMEEIHEGVCGTHSSGYSMAKKILRAGYYWLTMEKDCISYAVRCHKCQIYADKTHVPVNSLHVLAAPWPFSMWGIDVIGPIEPKASNGHRFILVAIDYFTKWVEANSYANVTSNVVVRFLRKDIVCRYGVPERIITDNGTNFNSKTVKEFCEQFKIKHHNSSPYRPKMNGAVEAANKNLKKIIQKMTENYKDWHEKLPFALYGYRTSARTSTGESPFALVYGTEAVLPIEVEIPSLRVMVEANLEETEWVKTRYEHLNLIEERRLGALCRGQLYQRRMIRAHHKKMHPRCFREGDLVLKMIQPPQKDHRGKWTPTYEGPYVVKKAFSGGAVILTKMDGDELPHPVNSDVLKRYYA